MDIRVDTGIKDAPIQVFWKMAGFYVDSNGNLRILTSSDPEVNAAIFKDWAHARLVSDEERKAYENERKA